MPPSSLRSLIAALLLVPVLAPAADDAKDGDETVVSEPTRDEIRDAYGARVRAINARAKDVLGAADAKSVILTVEDAQKLSCNSLDRKDIEFDCRVEVRTRIADGEPTTRLVNLWLIRDEDKWVVR
jgi:hypothetical protein